MIAVVELFPSSGYLIFTRVKAFPDSFLFSGNCIFKIFPIKIRGIGQFYFYRSAGVIQIITGLADLVLVQNDITVCGTIYFRYMRTGIAVTATGIQKSRCE